jgi:hypothetical protein
LINIRLVYVNFLRRGFKLLVACDVSSKNHLQPQQMVARSGEKLEIHSWMIAGNHFKSVTFQPQAKNDLWSANIQ